MAIQLRVIENITKEYPDMIKVIIYKEPQVYARSHSIKRQKKDVNNDEYIPKDSSLKRTKETVRDLAYCNDFEYFCTFTFDPKKVNSLNFESCRCTMLKWLHNQRWKSKEAGKELKYLIVPEQHKSGRWHFHALISGYTSTLKLTKHKTSSGRPIYNITAFRSGFTTATPLDENREAYAQYITKYITKDFIKDYNQRRFMCSRNLVRPKREVNSDAFSLSLPLFRHKVQDLGDREIYELDKIGL